MVGGVFGDGGVTLAATGVDVVYCVLTLLATTLFVSCASGFVYSDWDRSRLVCAFMLFVCVLVELMTGIFNELTVECSNNLQRPFS
jgi:hypothetical protein